MVKYNEKVKKFLTFLFKNVVLFEKYVMLLLNIHTYIMEEKGFDYTIQSIRMGYMTQIEDGAMHFFPVWYFQCKLGEKGITLLALDARNGAVIYMG